MPNFTDTIRAPAQVIAYHGCNKETLRRVARHEQLIPSTNAYDWLGGGIYFWEYGSHRAWEWAHARFAGDAAIVQATITLGHCLNLLDTGYFHGVQIAYQELAQRFTDEGRNIPTNRADKRHFLDRAVIDDFCAVWVRNGGEPFQTVRGCFPEGEPLYEGSKILRQTHVQISVRDATCILDLKPVE